MPDLFKNSIHNLSEFKLDKERKKRTAMTIHAVPIPAVIASRMFIKQASKPAKAKPDKIGAI